MVLIDRFLEFDSENNLDLTLENATPIFTNIDYEKVLVFRSRALLGVY